MKSKILLFFLMFFIAAFAKAEKTYVKDRAECALDGNRITLELRSADLLTEAPDDDYGDALRIEYKETIYPVKLGDGISRRYRLLRGQSKLCNKPLALRISAEEIAIFLSRDNRPFPNQLMVLFFNVKTRTSDVVETKILTSSGLVSGERAFFKLAARAPKSFGTVIIDQEKYQYVEETLEPWIAFDGKNFRLDRKLTYERFEHRSLITPGAFAALNEFRDLRYRIAVNPKGGQRCISLNQKNWSCGVKKASGLASR